jgi:hypothetical protein
MGILFWRRPKLPPARRPPLERDERVVAWAVTSRDQTVVATNRGLWLPTGPAEPLTRLAWDQVHKASWTGRELVIVPGSAIATLDGYLVTTDLPAVAFTLPDPGDVPVQVRARVTRSVAYTSQHALPGHGAARVVARRRPGMDGLHWTVRLEGGADIDDPVVREVTKGLVEAAIADVDR